MMPGSDFKSVREAIIDAYEEDELKIALRECMDVKLNNVVGSGNFPTRVFELLEWAEREGREVELIRTTAMSRPRNLKLQVIYRKYGMAVPMSVEQAGVNLPEGPTDATHPGLERTVRSHLSFSDFGIWRDRMTAVEGRVCQITLGGSPMGTGCLIGADAVLTNYHVMEAVLTGKRPFSEVECIFDFKNLPDGSKLRTPAKLHPTDWNIDFCPYSAVEKIGKPDEATPTFDELDFALVRLNEPLGAKAWAANPGSGSPIRGWICVPEAPIALRSPMGVIIAQHPNGWPMKLAIDTNAIDRGVTPPLWMNENGTRVRYATNTEGGSSGSPVFDLEWNLIALHHYGDSDYGHQPRYNQGIPIDKIRERLKRSNKLDALGGEPG